MARSDVIAYRFERRNGADSIVWRDVVHCHALSLDKADVGVLFDAFEGTVLCVEVECCGPIIASSCQHDLPRMSYLFERQDSITTSHSVSRSGTYLKSSLNVQVVQVLFVTKSCSPGFISA
jgi:hypothetical protein